MKLCKILYNFEKENILIIFIAGVKLYILRKFMIK